MAHEFSRGREHGLTEFPSQFPNTTYRNATSPNPLVAQGAQVNQTSPEKFPSPWSTGAGDWSSAYQKATALVAQMTLEEKVNVTTGVGWEGERCVGNTGSVPRLNFHSLCLQDSPLGVRDGELPLPGVSPHLVSPFTRCSRLPSY